MKFEKEVYINGYKQYINAFGDSLIEIKLSIVGQTDDVIQYLEKYNHQSVKAILEYQEPILDEEERKYLSGVIRPFRGRVDYIQKNIHSQREFISIALNGEIIAFPFFKKGAMYKGMQLNKEYTLKELGL